MVRLVAEAGLHLDDGRGFHHGPGQGFLEHLTGDRAALAEDEIVFLQLGELDTLPAAPGM